jgi:hypothetical protein
MLALFALLAGAAGGILSSRVLPEARADAGGGIIVPVPPQGIVFRGARGNGIVRVRDTSAGGVIEVLDSREQVAVRLRATPAGGAIEVGASGPPSAQALSLMRSPDDPGY